MALNSVVKKLVHTAESHQINNFFKGESNKKDECIVCKQPLTHVKFQSHIDVTARGYRCGVCYIELLQTFQTKTNLHCNVSLCKATEKLSIKFRFYRL